MHYKAERRVSADGTEVIGYIPAFLYMSTDNAEFDVLIKFLGIMESEISKGHSFDITFLDESRFYIDSYSDPLFGSTEYELNVLKYWRSKLDGLEIKNILNTHRNKRYFAVNAVKRAVTNFTASR